MGNAVDLARQYLIAVADRDPHATRIGVTLADAVLEEARAFDVSEETG